MPWFLIRVRRSAAGAPEVERFEAPTAAEAIDAARAVGFSEPELLTDDLSAGVGALFPAEKLERVRAGLSPAEERQAGSGGWAVAGLMFRKSLWVWIPALAIILWRRSVGAPFGGLEGLAWLILATIALAAILVQRATAPYNAMLAALVGGRFEEALRRSEKLRSKLPAYELAFRRARALHGLGRVAEAEAEMRSIDADPGVAKWMADLRWCDYHQLDLDAGQARAAAERAFLAQPGSAMVWLNAAELEAGPLSRDAERAAELLGRARQLPLAREVRWGVEKIEGMIRLGLGEAAAAIPSLEAARRELARLPYTAVRPAADAAIAVELARALAATGEKGRAAIELAAAEPWLVHHPLGRLLIAQARSELGSGQLGSA